MKVIITAGPSFEPIDEVRRLTNFSTGELGVRLANQLAAAGFEVLCLRGAAATYPGELRGAQAGSFTTNLDLEQQLTRLSQQQSIRAIFHAAALCDYQVARALAPTGEPLTNAKIDSRLGRLTLELEPATKVLAQLRSLFPTAILVGWKYELEGGRPEALAKAWRQITENRTDACVVNGRAYGSGFGWCTPPDRVVDVPDRTALLDLLTDYLKGRR